MSFFDKKEEVMDIELTPYGRFLLSLGRFKPEFYAFYDDDIVYDSNWSGHNEVQKEIHERIKEQTRIKQQPSNTSAETRAGKLNKQKKTNDLISYNGDEAEAELSISEYKEKNYTLGLPLGTSDTLYDYAPAWSVSFGKGGINQAVSYATGSHATFRIPQLDLKDIVVKSKIGESLGLERDTDECSDFEDPLFEQPFEDGTYVYVEDDYLLIDVEELNVEFGNENYEIEFFKKVTKSSGLGNSSSEETWEPLFFEESPRQIDENGLLIDPRDNMNNEVLNLSDNKIFVSHYFEILMDDEIPQNVLCLPSAEGQRLNVFGKQKINCETLEPQAQKTISDIYASNYEDEIEYCEDDEDSTSGNQSGGSGGGGY